MDNKIINETLTKSVKEGLDFNLGVNAKDFRGVTACLISLEDTIEWTKSYSANVKRIDSNTYQIKFLRRA